MTENPVTIPAEIYIRSYDGHVYLRSCDAVDGVPVAEMVGREIVVPNEKCSLTVISVSVDENQIRLGV